MGNVGEVVIKLKKGGVKCQGKIGLDQLEVDYVMDQVKE
jgi:hypothetical protein